jgi:hypothetical protein
MGFPRIGEEETKEGETREECEELPCKEKK